VRHVCIGESPVPLDHVLRIADEGCVGVGRGKEQEERSSLPASSHEVSRSLAEVLQLETLHGQRCCLVREVDRTSLEVLVPPAIGPDVIAQPAVEAAVRLVAGRGAVPLADQGRAVARLL